MENCPLETSESNGNEFIGVKSQHELCMFFEEIKYRWKLSYSRPFRDAITPNHRMLNSGIARDYFEPELTIFPGGPRGKRWEM